MSPYEFKETAHRKLTVSSLSDNSTYAFEVAASTNVGVGVYSKRCEILIVSRSIHIFLHYFVRVMLIELILFSLGRTEEETWIGVLIALLVLVVLATFLILVRYRQTHITGRLKFDGMDLSYFAVTRSNPLYPQLEKIKREYPDYEIDRRNIKHVKELGEGNFGAVFLAFASGLIEDDIEMKVAVKSLKEGGVAEVSEAFFDEMEIMMKFQHENIVRLLGVCTDQEPFYLVTEFMEQVT